MQISFYGATNTVTGSKYLFEDGQSSFLLDCGLFQGFKQLRLRNWRPLPFEPKKISAVVLTHAHIDHSGFLPVLVRDGFSGRIYCTKATEELCKIMLPDAAHLQEEEAIYANKRGFSRHKPARPLYTVAEAERALQQFHAVEFDEPLKLSSVSTARFLHAGHILGAAMVMIEARGRRILFSGDLGRQNDPLMRPPEAVDRADFLVLESTYGDRLHPKTDPQQQLDVHLSAAAARGGIVIIPAFAVGRAQTLLHLIARLKGRGKLAGVPVYLNSPMAVDVTGVYQDFRSQHRLSEQECQAACRVAEFVSTPEDSKALNAKRGPMIIVSASGMVTGGRVVHHVKAFAPDPKNLILFSGFQAAGTRGATILSGAKSVRIHGADIPIRAEVAYLDMLSAHADYSEILDWLRAFRDPPGNIYLTHGEPAAADQLRQHIEAALGWECAVPDYRETAKIP